MIYFKLMFFFNGVYFVLCYLILFFWIKNIEFIRKLDLFLILDEFGLRVYMVFLLCI